MILYVKGTRSISVETIKGELIVNPGDTFICNDITAKSYITNYGEDFEEVHNKPTVAPFATLTEDSHTEAKAIKAQIIALGKNPIPSNDVEKLTAQLEKITSETD